MVGPTRVERVPLDFQSSEQTTTYTTDPIIINELVPRPRVELGKPGLLSQYVCQFHQRGIIVGRVRLELTTRSFAWNFEVTLVLTISSLGEENIQSIFSFFTCSTN